MGSGRSDVLWNHDDSDLPRSFLGLIQIYSGQTATSLKCNELVACLVHVMWLNFTAKRRRCLIEHG